jgi:hypothetical protein
MFLLFYSHSIRSLWSLGRGIRQFSDGSYGDVAIGPGPERAVYRQAIANIVQDHRFWAPAANSGFYVPVFSVVSVAIPERCHRFSAYGSLLALHCFSLAQGPIPVSMWLLLALVSGRQGMLIPTEVLLALDPNAFDTLAPWLMMTPSDPMPTDFAHPLCQFLVNIMERQVCCLPQYCASHR